MADAIISEKLCTGCKETKPVSDFYVSEDNLCGYRSRCKACASLYCRARKNQPKRLKAHDVPIVIFYDGPVIGRSDARQAGLYKYFTGKPCSQGHVAERFVKGGCVICKAAQGSRWREDNLERHKDLQSRWYQENKEAHRSYGYAWSKANVKRRTAYSFKWRSKNRERVRRVKKLWRDSNQERVSEHERRKNAKRRLLTKHVVASRMRGRMYDALRRTGGSKDGKSWREYVPYGVDDLVSHLKRTMPAGYCWDDLLSGKLHVDHIIPVSAFNFTSPEDIDFQKCWTLKNLRLLPALENVRKGAKLEKPFQPSLAGI